MSTSGHAESTEGLSFLWTHPMGNRVCATRNALVLFAGASIMCGLNSPSYHVERRPLAFTAKNQADAPIVFVSGTAFQLINREDAAARYGRSMPNIAAAVGWSGRIKYRNRSHTAVTAIQFRWEFSDVFDQVRNSIAVTNGDVLNPGYLHEAEWEQDVLLGDVMKVTVAVEKVRFDDGTVWVPAPPKPKAETGNQPAEIAEALRAERVRLRAIYVEQGSQALLDALEEPKKDEPGHQDVPNREEAHEGRKGPG